MTDNALQKDFKAVVESLQQEIELNANGVDIIVGTKDKPIVSDSKLIPIKHYFMDGVYVREMTMYKDTVVFGAIHKHLHMCFLLKGHLTVVSEEGRKEYIAPCFVIAEPGAKRVLYSHEDSVWYNTHKNPANTEDVRQLEKEIVATTYEEYNEYIKNK